MIIDKGLIARMKEQEQRVLALNLDAIVNPPKCMTGIIEWLRMDEILLDGYEPVLNICRERLRDPKDVGPA